MADRAGEVRFSVLHLSDLHERIEAEWMSAARRKKIQVRQAQRFRVLDQALDDALQDVRSLGPLHGVCFTGDVADWGLKGEFEAASVRFGKILERLEVPRQRFFAVPGNHDINRNIAKPTWKKLRAAAYANSAGVSEWMAGLERPKGLPLKGREEILERQAAFWEWLVAFRGDDALSPLKSPHGALGYRCSLPGLSVPVTLIGLDSAWLAGDDHDTGNLFLSDAQLDRLCTGTEGAPLAGYRLAMMHHPISNLLDARKAKDRLSEYVDLVLHGHQHDPVIENVSTPDKGLRVFAAGSLYEGDYGDRWVNAFQRIDVYLTDAGRPKRYELTFWGWSERGHWHRHGALYKAATNGQLIIHEPLPRRAVAAAVPTRQSARVREPVPPLLLRALRRAHTELIADTFSRLLEKSGEFHFTVTVGGLTVQQLLSSEHRTEDTLIYGEPGGGKTYLLYEIFGQLIDAGECLPIFLPASACDGRSPEGGVDWGRAICDYYDYWLSDTELETLRQAVSPGSGYDIVLLLDALDEVDASLRVALLRGLNSLRQANPDLRVLATCREAEMWSTDLRATTEFRKLPLQARDTHKVLLAAVDRRGKKELARRLKYLGDLRNPLIGCLVLSLLDIDRDPGFEWSLPEVYHSALGQLLLHQYARIAPAERVNDFIEPLIAALADIFGTLYCAREDISEQASVRVAEASSVYRVPFLKNPADYRAWLLGRTVFKRNRHKLEVLHVTVHEYLVALYLFNMLAGAKPIDARTLFARDFTIRHSHFLTDLLTSSPSPQIEANLRTLYEGNANVNSLDALVSRQQAAFYAGVTGTSNIEQKILSDVPVVRRGYIVGAAIAGHGLDRFREYCKLLVTDREAQIVDLSYSLVHQGDYVPTKIEEYSCLPLQQMNCRNAIVGMIRQLLKKEYQPIDLLAVITLHGYLKHCEAQVREVMIERREWFEQVRPEFGVKLNEIRELESDPKFVAVIDDCMAFWQGSAWR